MTEEYIILTIITISVLGVILYKFLSRGENNNPPTPTPTSSDYVSPSPTPTPSSPQGTAGPALKVTRTTSNSGFVARCQDSSNGRILVPELSCSLNVVSGSGNYHIETITPCGSSGKGLCSEISKTIGSDFAEIVYPEKTYLDCPNPSDFRDANLRFRVTDMVTGQTQEVTLYLGWEII